MVGASIKDIYGPIHDWIGTGENYPRYIPTDFPHFFWPEDGLLGTMQDFGWVL
jgi:hypothetical protein